MSITNKLALSDPFFIEAVFFFVSYRNRLFSGQQKGAAK